MKSSPDVISPDIATSLARLLEVRVRKNPGTVAYRYFDKVSANWESVTWQQTLERVGCWRTALEQEGLAAGERVAIMLPNGIDWVCLDMAAHSLGLVVVPLYVNDRPENVAYIIEDTGARIFALPGRNY